MSSAYQHFVSQRKLKREVRDVGKRLLELPSSTDEWLILLEEAERVLAKVWQEPSESMSDALRLVMKALITDQLLRHTDVDIQVAVASCFNEISRITAPTFPYPDDNMKELFKLVLIAFKQLACESGSKYSRALEILETMAKTKSSLLMLDMDSDGLVVEMFQIFVDTIRSDHPSDVFENMETIMTLVVDESDEISFELLKPLLDSVRTANKETSPIAWKLGKKIFENCATKLQLYLRESVKSMNLDLKDYADIVTSICQDTSSGGNMMGSSSDEESDISDSEINEYKEKPYELLKAGTYKVKGPNGTLRWPFCAGKKKQDYQFNHLYQHAIGTRKGSAKGAKLRANHLALATYLETDLANEAETQPQQAVPAPAAEPEQNEYYCWPWVGIIVNIVNEPKSDTSVDYCGYWLMKVSKYKPSGIEIFLDDHRLTAQAVLKFDNDWTGFKHAMELEKSFEADRKSKKETSKSISRFRYLWLVCL